VIERVSALPGVVSAGYVKLSALTFKGGRAPLDDRGQAAARTARGDAQHGVDRVVAGDYFRALGVPLLAAGCSTRATRATRPWRRS